MKNNKLFQFQNFSFGVYRFFSVSLIIAALMSSCSVSNQIKKIQAENLLKDSVIATGHTGISIYEPATGSYWYNYNADKFFVPASNTKLFTLYAGMKYLGDSLVGVKYFKRKDTLHFMPTGDPTFLHPDFAKQIVFDSLYAAKYLVAHNAGLSDTKWGTGWAWDDYSESFMPERSIFPIYGNVIRIKSNHYDSNNFFDTDSILASVDIIPRYFKNISFFEDINIRSFAHFDKSSIDSIAKQDVWFFTFKRSSLNENIFEPELSLKKTEIQSVPFVTKKYTLLLLEDTIKKKVLIWEKIKPEICYTKRHKPTGNDFEFHNLYSRPSDSLFRPMMHNSDNFFAEQTLLMVSNEKLGYMNDRAIIDTLLQTDLQDIPQKPRWVDGSGLSRYNLFTPQSFIYILNKMRNEFGSDRLKNILPTGGEGTLRNYFVSDSGHIYAKTGTLGNQFALSGILETKKGKSLLFSVLCNNFQGSTTQVRRRIEAFLNSIRENF